MEMTVQVVGVEKRNDDGSSRQALLKGCKRGEQLQLVRDYGNRQNKNAVMVCRVGGRQIGYLSSWIAEQVAQDIDKGKSVVAMVATVSGGGWLFKRKRNVDVTISVKNRRAGKSA